MVKRVRSQSQLAPSFLSCSRITPPYCSFQAQACSRNFSRPSCCLVSPSSRSFFTTLASVAIEAWSVPGTQQAFLPSSRALRMRMS